MLRAITSAWFVVLGLLPSIGDAQSVVYDGLFPEKADVHRLPAGTVIQTLSPENHALTVITESLHVFSGQAEIDSLILRLKVATSPNKASSIDVSVRGDINVDGRAGCRTMLIKDGAAQTLSPQPADLVLAHWKVPISPSTTSFEFLMVVICQQRGGTYGYWVDAVDMAWSYEEVKR